jgi:hypothetical protein
MALVTLLLPLPALLLGSAIFTLAPRAYQMQHHGGPVGDSPHWGESPHSHLSGAFDEMMRQTWDSGMHAHHAASLRTVRVTASLPPTHAA